MEPLSSRRLERSRTYKLEKVENLEKSQKESKRIKPKQKEFIIPFSERKGKLLSISFRSLDIEMGIYKLKIQANSNKDELTSPLFSEPTETIMVRK